MNLYDIKNDPKKKINTKPKTTEKSLKQKLVAGALVTLTAVSSIIAIPQKVIAAPYVRRGPSYYFFDEQGKGPEIVKGAVKYIPFGDKPFDMVDSYVGDQKIYKNDIQKAKEKLSDVLDGLSLVDKVKQPKGALKFSKNLSKIANGISFVITTIDNIKLLASTDSEINKVIEKNFNLDSYSKQGVIVKYTYVYGRLKQEIKNGNLILGTKGRLKGELHALKYDNNSIFRQKVYDSVETNRIFNQIRTELNELNQLIRMQENFEIEPNC